MNIRLLCVTACVVLLSACMSMPLKTMYKMSQFSPMDIEPQGLRLAVRTDQGIQLQKGAVTISFGFESLGNGDLAAVKEDYAFKVVILPDVKTGFSPLLFDGIADNESVTVMQLSEQDAQTMAQAQALIRQYKAADVDINGYFSLGMEGKCFGNMSAYEYLEADLFLKTNTTEDYFIFMEDVDIIEQAQDHDIDLKQINKCE
ncbi:hypothetical protein J1N51_09895 [Psychrosphaera ytuae]|uniref:Lipoprotein n=1 Tax=Psychrosphaera ytuae TaxID=2820710 RepID=A0A975DA87_9GAMM|nr:hypothetical protein [Psychrosphaera ytuae]QTH63054.1 hypothetical protein J1N51_09895 [Psychrosphaera ytuae]